MVGNREVSGFIIGRVIGNWRSGLIAAYIMFLVPIFVKNNDLPDLGGEAGAPVPISNY